MTAARTRYPGAQPFADDDLSRKVFFGREQASLALTNQILANRMVVVYAKSGLGKSSLLNAGVAQRLRDEGYLPLIVRVNDIECGPFLSVLEGIRAAAERQGIEYVPGKPDSLWTFFKTVEFWRGDLLLTPVLILDQFEELFTLLRPEPRTAFIADLGYLVRGVRPPSAPATDADLTETPPALRTVLSLREDYLGLLEEAADRIPQILDHRFRLTPLTVDAAGEAMTGPAAIDDAAFQTNPFRYDPETVATILNYLSHRRTKAVAEKMAYVEPFHLQLICQRIEAVAAKRQHDSAAGLSITMKDIGGEAALKRILKDFYKQAVGAFPRKRVRRAVRRLCEDYLISPEGRRLSLEEHEILRQLRLPAETLRQLVNNRLLRSDSRSDSTYYELSHDALVEPVLVSRSKRGILVGAFGIIAGILGFPAALLIIMIAIVQAVQGPQVPEDATTRYVVGAYMGYYGAVYGILLIGIGVLLSARWVYTWSSRTVRRYRLRSADDSAVYDYAVPRLRDRVGGWLQVLAGSAVLVLSVAFAAVLLTWLVGSYYTEGKPPGWVSADMHEEWRLLYEGRPRLDFVLASVAVPIVLLFGTRLLRRGLRARKRHPRGSPPGPVEAAGGTETTPPLRYGRLRLVGGIIALIVGSVWGGWLSYTLVRIFSTQGNPPDWLPARYHDEWRSTYEHFLSLDGWIIDYGFQLLAVTAVLLYAAKLLSRGIRTIRDHGRSIRATAAASG